MKGSFLPRGMAVVLAGLVTGCSSNPPTTSSQPKGSAQAPVASQSKGSLQEKNQYLFSAVLRQGKKLSEEESKTKLKLSGDTMAKMKEMQSNQLTNEPKTPFSVYVINKSVSAQVTGKQVGAGSFEELPEHIGSTCDKTTTWAECANSGHMTLLHVLMVDCAKPESVDIQIRVQDKNNAPVVLGATITPDCTKAGYVFEVDVP